MEAVPAAGAGISANILTAYELAIRKWEVFINKNWLLSNSWKYLREIRN